MPNAKQITDLHIEVIPPTEGSLEDIYHKYWSELYVYAYNILKDKDAAENVVQEVFISLIQKEERNDIRNRIVVNINYHKAWSKMWTSNFALFVTAQSGTPYTFGFVNYTPQNSPQQIGLAYIPAKGETINFFAATPTQTAQQQAAAFDAFIDGNKYLSSRRGGFTQRNAARTPWNNNADFHFAQDINFNTDKGSSELRTLTFSLDIMNLTNLVNKNWGKVYFAPNTYNSTSSVGLVSYIPARSSQGYPLYQFVNPGTPYSVDPFASRWQMQIGARYTF